MTPKTRIHVSDYRLLFARSDEERKRILELIERRSQAAKAGWAKRRALHEMGLRVLAKIRGDA